MRSAVKILAMVGAVLSLPFDIAGWGLLITIPLVILAVSLDRKASSTNGGSRKWALIAVLVGSAVLFGFYALGSLGNLDTTGKPSSWIMVIGFVVSIFVGLGVYKLGNNGRKTLPPR